MESVVLSVAGAPLLWYSADKISGVANGVGLIAWRNAGTYGTTGDVTQSTLALRPTLVTNSQNGYPGVRFTASATQYMVSGTVAIAPKTAILIANSIDTVNNPILDGDFNSYTVMGSRDNATNLYIYGGGTSTFSTTNGVLVSGSAFVGSFVWNGASSFVKTNGAKTTGNVTQNTNTRFALGSAIYRGGSTAWNGTLYELLMWDKVLTETQVNQIEAAYAAKYALTAYTLT